MHTCHRFLIPAAFCVLAALAAGPAAASSDSPALGDLSKVGTVRFPVSCDAALQPEFDRGLALLHSFFYDEARRVFAGIAAADPECAMAHWGIAMTYWHPLWTPPDSVEFAAGLAAAQRAKSAKKQDAREQEWVKAVVAYYEATATPATAAAAAAQQPDPSCHGPRTADPAGRAAAFRAAMEEIAAHHPDDTESTAFLALALLGTAKPGDPALGNQHRAAGMLEERYAAHPTHPGLAHYLIHSYDYPPLAKRGLAAANAYAGMQPWVPHALHMPSHIYTRLGMWNETVESNRASAAAARAYEAKFHPGAAASEELHALDYQMYALLQMGQDRAAKTLLARLAGIKKTHPETDFASGYAFGAMPARYALERREWKEAAAIAVPPMALFQKLPFAAGHITYANAIGAARSGDLAAAERAAGRLAELSASITDQRFRYFAQQMDLQRQAALGLIALARGEKDEAVRLLADAAAREDSLGKHPVSPGSILPIRELYAETLLETGRPAEALAQFEASLAIYPKRFNGVAGAAEAAAAAGKADLARAYFGQLIEIAKSGDGARPQLRRAADFMSALTD